MSEAVDWKVTTEAASGLAQEPSAQPLEQPLRLLIADDHALFRRGLREVLEEEEDMRVVAEAADGVEAVRRARAMWPNDLDLVIMDVDMPHQNGTSAARQIVRELPGLPVVMLTVSTLDRDLYGSALAGAAGFLSKSLAPTAILRTLRDFRREGALPMSRTTAAKVLTYFQHMASEHEGREAGPVAPVMRPPGGGRALPSVERPEGSLTPREREVFALMTEGARDREIADRLFLTESTVKSHVQSILRKLGARNRTEAVARLRRGAE